ncbi:DUF5063 domain-containing protein [Cellulomonas carbonis]|uniref:DUF5063 domain-containing protein n=1 Tax=Cellulomonas carbonis T26 TaxID=947969 RepID=A0A0A0BUG9_9CELL|nr:DUF5063 domain-containing protein [Cellulomonas carbonis]KGM12063.1 hypothetical protein N868_02725 [Cellulomonas carbonis T26]GGC08181.1 hypothetical protein GCM10010972_21790 [Cellulomonas carbonis]
MPDNPDPSLAVSAEAATPADLVDVARSVSDEARRFVTTVTEVAANTLPEVAIPLLLLAVSDVLAAGARLGAMTDVVPPDRFEPDVGPDADLDPLRAALENVLEGIDDYVEVDDPLLGEQLVSSSVSGDLVLVAGALVQGQRHFDNGQVLEALWWWQYSYLANWGERASAVLRVLQTILAHLRLDVDDDVAAEAEFQALHP